MLQPLYAGHPISAQAGPAHSTSVHLMLLMVMVWLGKLHIRAAGLEMWEVGEYAAADSRLGWVHTASLEDPEMADVARALALRVQPQRQTDEMERFKEERSA